MALAGRDEAVAAAAGPAGQARTGGAEATSDPFDIGFVLGLDPDSLLGRFNRAGVLSAADVHVALRLGRMGGETREAVLLAAALAVRAPRAGHVRVELASVRETLALDAEEEVDIDGLPWPGDSWADLVRASPLVAVDQQDSCRPLRLWGTALYLDRHWRDERLVAESLLARAGAAPPAVDTALLSEGLVRLFPEPDSGGQRWAAAAALTRRLSVVAGGPGTGKTTTIARLLALLDEQEQTGRGRQLLIALAAPTGKAANRMQEAVAAELDRMSVTPDTRRRLASLRGSTLHRLLGPHPGRAGRFRHDRQHRLAHDVVIVDETSMVPAALMARLLEAVRPEARLVLLGDPQQLASVEAGAVLGDVVGPTADGMIMRPEASGLLREITHMTVPVQEPVGHSPAIADGIVVLRTNFRFRGGLGDLAGAVRDGDPDRAIEVLRRGEEAVAWLEIDPATASERALGPVKEVATAWSRALREAAAAAAAEPGPALALLGRTRILCAHRRGPAGVAAWNQRIEGWLGQEDPGVLGEGAWYPGRPVMLTANDYSLRLFNGDTGVSLQLSEHRRGVAFARPSGADIVSPARLGAVETVYANTVHKAQGSEFENVVVLLPGPGSRLLSRELLYTALTRATTRVLLVGTEAAVREAVSRRISRSSGLADLLWTAQ
jgi:exodeoxyribonuclease V alpha subunit